MLGRGIIARIRTKTIPLTLIATLAFDGLLAPRAHASLVCAGLFAATESTLPPQLALLLGQISPKQRIKFEERFERREVISAEREASRLIARLLIKGDDADLKMKPIATSNTRTESIRSLLNARLDIESNRIELENTLIDIGYAEGSQTSQEWRAFRDRHRGQLAIAKAVAINVASTYVFGVPLFLSRVKTLNFNLSKSERRAWPDVERKLRARIESSDPVLVREVKFEVALELVRRIVAIAVLAVLTDELLTYLTPKWGVLKMKVHGSLVIESRDRLEAQAFENWKDLDEAYTGTRPTDASPEARDILARIHATSKDDLWLYIHEGGGLSDPQPNLSSAP